jgi:hypothetical protein
MVKTKYKISLILILAVLSNLVSAQTSGIRGTIYDDETNETLIGVSVQVEGLSIGDATDLDGDFTIKLSPGTYTIQCSYLSYQTRSIREIIVKENDFTILDNIKLKTEAAQLEQVVVRSTAINNTEVALLTQRKKSSNLIDGISSSNFRRIGDSNAASAMSRVTGVSITGGKYVFVRGLGDRYTKTTLNGLDVPGLDPDRNSIQMDIFPTNMIDNIIVSKSFTADQPADFTGGIVDINTKSFPERETFKVGVGIGYNPAMHFNDNYLKAPTSSTDFLGFDDGQRDIPIREGENIPQVTDAIVDINGPEGMRYREILNDFSKEMQGMRQQNTMNKSLSLSYGNQKEWRNKKWGYTAGITYKEDIEFYEEAEFNLFGKAADPNTFELISFEQQRGDFGVRNVLVGGIAGLAMKTNTSKVTLNAMHLQNGESKAGQFIFENTNVGSNFTATQYNVEYSQRSLSNVILQGKHLLTGETLNLEWKLAGTHSEILDPDIRFTRFRIPDNNVGTEVGLPARIWRTLMEDNLAGRVDLEKKFVLLSQPSSIKTGAMYTYKQRSFNIQDFQFLAGNARFTGNPDELFESENLFAPENINGVRYNPLFIPNNPNQFTSSVFHFSAYIMNDFKLMSNLKGNIGVRFESFDQEYTGINQTGSIRYNNENVLSDMNFFPALNLNYEFAANQSLRASYSKTIARPSFKEISYAEILDPITGRTFVGGLFTETSDGGETVLWDGNLQSTLIDNFDLRWEYFQERGEMLSVSLFYKNLQNPIEVVQFLSDPGSFQPRNVGNAELYGAEVEIRKSLGFIHRKLEKFLFQTNGTLTYSEIELSATEKESRLRSARTGEEVSDTRSMAGQAPWIINSGIIYSNERLGLEASTFYNVQARTLEFVGFGNRTDIYSVPFHSLNFNLNKRFGEDRKYSVGLKVSNLLNDAREKVFTSYNAGDRIFTRLLPQRTFSLSFNYSI